jgi:ligand-binding SRPBCC domain-containing protein
MDDVPGRIVVSQADHAAGCDDCRSMDYVLSDRFDVASDIDTTWKFFSLADNLPKITPPWLKFTLVSCPKIELNTQLDYTIRWMGFPIRWRTLIIDWNPPYKFIDLQIRGPYTLWHHEHTFTPTANGVRCTDRVIYKLPVPLVRRIIHPLVVRRQLLEIFRFRRNAIARSLGWAGAVQTDVEIREL